MLIPGFDFLAHILSEVTAGLIGIGLTIGVERAVKFVGRRRLEKRFPIAGTYMSKYEDKGRIVTAPVELKQRGSEVQGESYEGNRKWILKGLVTEDGYLQGRYWAENVFDKGFGSFLLKIEPNCDMHGYWFGKDIKEREIQRGSYDFYKRDISIEPVSPRDIPALLDIAEKQLGDAYINRRDLENGKDRIALSAAVNGRVVGFGTARVIPAQEFYGKFEPFFKQDPTALRPLQRRLPDKENVGLVASVAIAPEFHGRGIGTALVERCIQELAARGVTVLVATAWHSRNGTNAGSLLENKGFQKVLEVPEFWKEASLQNNFSCPVCGPPPCECAATVYVRSL